jgi:hypothetical protein
MALILLLGPVIQILLCLDQRLLTTIVTCQKKILILERNLSNSQRLPLDIDFGLIADKSAV